MSEKTSPTKVADEAAPTPVEFPEEPDEKTLKGFAEAEKMWADAERVRVPAETSGEE